MGDSREPDLRTSNAGLLKAIEAHVRHDDWASRKAVYKALLESALAVPGQPVPARRSESNATNETASKTDIEFASSRKPNGEKTAFVFTDEEALRASGWNGQWLIIKARPLFSMFLKAGIDDVVINPFKGEAPVRPGGLITHGELEFLATGVLPVAFRDHHAEFRVKSIAVGQPSQPLDLQTERALIAGARRLREIGELIYFESSADSGPFHPTIGIGFGTALFPRKDHVVIERLMAQIQPEMATGQVLDIVPLNKVPRSDVLEKGVVIYRRGKGPMTKEQSS